MDHYIDLRVRPDPETATAHILNAMAGRLHLALARLQSEDIGISFPRFRLATQPPSNAPPAAGSTRQLWRPTLGDTLRLHGRHDRLRQLMALDWLAGLGDYTAAEEARPVPPDAKHRVVTRRQVHSSADRIRRRQMKRHGLTEQEAQARIPDSVEKRLALPFLQLRSQSTGQAYRLFIEHLPCRNEAASGTFNTYGLSASTTVPWF
jgi:CRISPR-associated endonuclease Csy4